MYTHMPTPDTRPAVDPQPKIMLPKPVHIQIQNGTDDSNRLHQQPMTTKGKQDLPAIPTAILPEQPHHVPLQVEYSHDLGASRKSFPPDGTVRAHPEPNFRTPQFIENVARGPETFPIVSRQKTIRITVYAIPYAFTSNGEPLFMRYGTESAAIAADAASSIGCKPPNLPHCEEIIPSDGCMPLTNEMRNLPHYESENLSRAHNYGQPVVAGESGDFDSKKGLTRGRDANMELESRSLVEGLRERCGPQQEIRAQSQPRYSGMEERSYMNGQSLECQGGFPHIRANNTEPIYVRPIASYERTWNQDPCGVKESSEARGVTREDNKMGMKRLHDEIICDRDGAASSSSNEPMGKKVDSRGEQEERYGSGYRSSGSRPSIHQGRSEKRRRLIWTQELHQSFVEAVEKLGVDQAVPTSIMQIMNMEILTRENVASHLQKYRGSLRKEREAKERKMLLKVAARNLLDKDSCGRHGKVTEKEVMDAVTEKAACGGDEICSSEETVEDELEKCTGARRRNENTRRVISRKHTS